MPAFGVALTSQPPFNGYVAADQRLIAEEIFTEWVCDMMTSS